MRAGKFIVLGGVVSFVLALALVLMHDPVIGSIAPLLLVAFGIYPLIAGSALWVLGWIAEGFLLPGSRGGLKPPSDRDSTVR
jgi:hypothetical protein